MSFLNQSPQAWKHAVCSADIGGLSASVAE